MDTSGPGTGREKVSLPLVRAGERLPRSSHGFFLSSCQRANRASAWAERNYYSSCSIEIKKNLRAFTPESPGLVHHSDRGVQYASAEYVQVLREHGMELSMSRAHNPYDNATCESFIKTLKVEEIYIDQYQDLEICASMCRNLSSSTTIAAACTPRWAIALQKSLNNSWQLRPPEKYRRLPS